MDAYVNQFLTKLEQLARTNIPQRLRVWLEKQDSSTPSYSTPSWYYKLLRLVLLINLRYIYGCNGGSTATRWQTKYCARGGVGRVHMEAFIKVDGVEKPDDSGGCAGGDQSHLYQQLNLPRRNWRRWECNPHNHLGYLYHDSCIVRWLEKSRLCPLCRFCPLRRFSTAADCKWCYRSNGPRSFTISSDR